MAMTSGESRYPEQAIQAAKAAQAPKATQTITQRTTAPVLEDASVSTNKQFMPSTSLAALETLISVLAKGGTPQQKAEIAKKKTTQQLLEGMLGQYTTQRAFADAEQLMALQLQRAMEKQMPAIERSIEGAGTSASSMQGILAQQMARDAALASGTLGAQQAAQYAQATTGLTGQLAGLAREAMDPATTALMEALKTARGAVEFGTVTTTGRKTGGGFTDIQTIQSPETPILAVENMSWAGPDSPAVINADPVAYLQKAMQQAKLSQSIYNI